MDITDWLLIQLYDASGRDIYQAYVSCPNPNTNWHFAAASQYDIYAWHKYHRTVTDYGWNWFGIIDRYDN